MLDEESGQEGSDAAEFRTLLEDHLNHIARVSELGDPDEHDFHALEGTEADDPSTQAMTMLEIDPLTSMANRQFMSTALEALARNKMS